MRWILSLLFAACLAGCASEQPLVTREPPMPKEERRPLKPGSNVFWKPGHWAWDPEAQHYYWVVGTWHKERADRFYVPGYWKSVEEDGQGGWRWIEPRWARKEELDALPPD